MDKFTDFFVSVFSKLKGAWEYIPRKLKLAAVGLLLAFVRAKFPGYIPDEITPEQLLLLFGGLITAHTLTDIAHVFASGYATAAGLKSGRGPSAHPNNNR